MGSLTGKVAWVTGAGSGIGQAAAVALAKEGATVVLTGRRKAPLAATAAMVKKAGGRAEVKPADLNGYEAYRRLRAACPNAGVSLTTGFGYDSAHSIVKARADGMKQVLFKPFRQEQVVKAVLDGPPEPAANGKPE